MPEHEINSMEDPAEDLPLVVLESILRSHLADPTAILSSVDAQSLAREDRRTVAPNNTLYRVQITWDSKQRGSSGSVDWLIKAWRPGGLSEMWMGIAEPSEALAWEHGLLRSEELPPGISTPFVGAVLDPSRERAWVAMTDVSAELSEYDGSRPLPPGEAVVRAKTVLDGLARLHARWEQPERQVILDRCPWLSSLDNILWGRAAMYARCLGREPQGGTATGGVVTDVQRANIQAFLDWLPDGDRRLWQDLMCDRRPLVSALQGLPRTLIHCDLDPRNIGLRFAQREDCDDQGRTPVAELVLIDWEWIGRGPGVLDAAYAVFALTLVCDPSQPYPEEAILSGELSDHYFERYREWGGTGIDHRTWQRTYGLAWLAMGIIIVPSTVGGMIRAVQGSVPGRQVAAIPEAVMRRHLESGMLALCRRYAESVTQAAMTWLA